MANSKKALDDILHKLDHQKLEAIGVESLSEDAKRYIMLVTAVSKVVDLPPPVKLGSFLFLAKVMEEEYCIDCKELAERICSELQKSLDESTEFRRQQETEEEER